MERIRLHFSRIERFVVPPIFNYLIGAKNVSDLWNGGGTPSYYGAACIERGSFCQHITKQRKFSKS